jgi:hypothetical protein
MEHYIPPFLDFVDKINNKNIGNVIVKSCGISTLLSF